MGATSLLRAALPSVPVVNRLPGVRKHPSPGGELHRMSAPIVIGRGAVVSYADVCGFPARDTVPLTYLHVLTFPLQLALMGDPGFPAPALGMVHVGNSITRHRPATVGETVTVRAGVGAGRPHRSGTAYDFRSTLCAEDGEVVWESTSTYLHRGERHPDVPRESSLEPVSPSGPVHRLGADLGRRYASVSGDHNPIHLSALTAKAFGFRRQIAHGMWSLARSVAVLENRLPERVRVDAEFRAPVYLPGTVAVGLRRTEGGYAFSLTSPGHPERIHLLGRALAV